MNQTKQTEKIQRGFIALLDTIFALVALILFSTIIFTYFQKLPSINDAFIYKQAYDILTVMEYSNFSNPDYVFQQTPASLCMRLEIYDAVGGVLTDIYYKAGCLSNTNEIITWRSFILKTQFKTAKLAVWRRS